MSEAVRSFKDDPSSKGMTRAELRAMFHFAECSAEGSKVVQAIERSGLLGDPDAEVSYAAIVAAILERRAS